MNFSNIPADKAGSSVPGTGVLATKDVQISMLWWMLAHDTTAQHNDEVSDETLIIAANDIH